MQAAESRVKVEKRNRPPVSCEPCRTRKLKCNRALPCESCIKRNKVSSCQYATNAVRGKPGPSKTRDLKDRLETLENLVTTLMSGNANVLPQKLKDLEITGTRGNSASNGEDVETAQSDVPKSNSKNLHNVPVSTYSGTTPSEALSSEAPFLQDEDGQLNYIDPGHWQSILEDIKEVKEHLTGTGSPMHTMGSGGSPSHDGAQGDASFLFGLEDGRATLSEILSSLPAQAQCDVLLAGYFNTPFIILAIVHPDKFRREYETFWISPLAASPLWLALLFSILAIATGMRKLSTPHDPITAHLNPKTFQQRAIQCLVLGKYATANAYALEAFVLHLQSLFITKDEPPVNPWFELGTVIRLAFRMGYHRDPANLSKVSVFEGEMRRRVWLNIVQTEALLSFQTGFPSMIPVDFCDTTPPRNLHYSDLHEEMTVLQTSRPLTEHTPTRYAIIKNAVMSVFRKLVAHTQSRSQPAYEQTLALDKEMRDAYAGIPEEFKRRPINRSFMDPLGTIFERTTIELLYCKGLIILHRRYITEDPLSPTYAYSRRACVEAALDILAKQLDLHKACEPGGRLQENRTMVLALPNHDYLLAAMVLCLDLSVRSRLDRENPGLERDIEQLDRELQALKTSQQVWTANDSAAPETRVASMAIDVMVRKLTGAKALPNAMAASGHGHGQNSLPVPSTLTRPPTEMSIPAGTFGTVAFPHTGITPHPPPSYSIIDPALQPQTQFPSQLPWENSMTGMIDGTEMIDWGSLDQYFLLGVDDFNAEYQM